MSGEVIDTARLRELLAKAALTHLQADYIPPDSEADEGWRVHDFPENSDWANCLASEMEQAPAELFVAAVNALPALLDRIDTLEASTRHDGDAGVLREALEKADAALRNHACHGGPTVPCIRTADQCAADCGKDAGDALLAVEAALRGSHA